MDKPRLNILLIEDNPDDARLVCDMLNNSGGCGTIVSKAERLSTALDMLGRQKFDIVLVDLGLPDSSGLESLQEIQKKAPMLPVVILTGFEDTETSSDALSIGAQDYLIKGEFNRKQLLRCIEFAINRKNAQSFLERAHDEVEYNFKRTSAELSVFNAELNAQMEQHTRTEEELLGYHKQLHDLAVHLQSIREEERANIAREIHDELGQIMTVLKMDLVWIGNRLRGDQKELRNKLGSDIELVENTIASVKRLCTELRPSILDSLGLEAALEWQCEEFEKRTGIGCKIDILTEKSVTDKNMKTALFRIFQEALTNVVRHSRASKIEALLTNMDDSIVLQACDNGRGITQEELEKANSFGLLGMRERVSPWNGRIEVTGTKGIGTTVSAIIPLNGQL